MKKNTKTKTHIAAVLERNADKERYDAEAKKILADKTILAWILQYSVEEMKNLSIAEIKDCIEGQPEISTVSVYPGTVPEAVTGMSNEDKVPGEGQVTFDIRFSAIIPGGNAIKLIINIEAQNKFSPGYDLVTRAVFYCARLLSAQMDTEFTSQNYNHIKKVYSIWICMEPPRYAAHTITRYRLRKEEVYGKYKKIPRYDLMEVVMICLGDRNKAGGNALHGMLETLFSGDLSVKEKEWILEQEYHIPSSIVLKGGFEKMCNLSDSIEEKALKKGREKGRIEGRKEGRQEGRQEGREEGRKEGRQEGRQEGREEGSQTLISLVKEGLISLSIGAAKAGMLETEFAKLLQ